MALLPWSRGDVLVIPARARYSPTIVAAMTAPLVMQSILAVPAATEAARSTAPEPIATHIVLEANRDVTAVPDMATRQPGMHVATNVVGCVAVEAVGWSTAASIGAPLRSMVGFGK